MKINKSDITTHEDVKLMVDTFYEKVNKNELLSYVFNDYSKVDWEVHLPKMYDFWNTLLFADGNYKGTPFTKHVGLPVGKQHFERWIGIFCENIEEHFEGEVAEQTKLRARTIAYTFQSKLHHLEKLQK